jgi:hypothetical protein
VSDAPRDERVYARAQLEHFTNALYSDPSGALAAMRHAAELEGTEAVRNKLEHDFKAFGQPAPKLLDLEAQRALRYGGLAKDLEGWLRLDQTAAPPQIGPDGAIEGPVNAPDAESPDGPPHDAPPRQEPSGGIREDRAIGPENEIDRAVHVPAAESLGQRRLDAPVPQEPNGDIHEVRVIGTNTEIAEGNVPDAESLEQRPLAPAVRQEPSGGIREDRAIRSDTEIGAVNAPNAESLGRRPPDAALPQEQNGGFYGDRARRQHLSPDEAAVLEQVEAFAAARERAKQRATSDGQLLGVADHLAHLQAAEAKLPAAREALKAELPGVFTKPSAAEKVIEEAMKEHGPAETARRVRSGDLLAGEQKKVFLKDRAMKIFPRRDHAAEAVNRERVAKRIETIAVCEGDLGKWSTYQPLDGAPVSGAQNVKAALELDRARIISDGGYNAADVREIERSTASKPHPALEAEQLERSARANLESLSPASRERVVQAARSGSDAVASAIGYLQTLQMATRTIREGIEGPGQ